MAKEQLIVVGAGVAGCAAALEAAQLGLKVTLIDEHPQGLQAMSLDAPYFYGARLAAVLDDAATIGERVLGANEPLLECLEAGVEILTGTCIWGSYRPGANSTHLAAPQLGLADGERSWLIEYDHLILAPGSRDLVLSFPGWQLPGVLGANGAAALLDRYQALSGSRMVILGSGNIALRTAKLALEKGVTVAALVEAAPAIRGDAALAAELAQAGVSFHTGHTIERALGEQEVCAVRLVAVDAATNPVRDSAQEIACDTVCMAFGAVPNVELASLTGCRIAFDAARGGWAPVLDASFRSSIANVYVAGDGAGVAEPMHLDPGIAAEQGRRAARAVAAAEGRNVAAEGEALAVAGGDSVLAAAGHWLRSLVKAGGMDVVVCQCEDVTRRELLEVSPPKYLNAGNLKSCGGVGALPPASRNSQDILKRMTRAGMGHCQGKRCRDQVLLLLAEAAGTPPAALVPGSYRAPVRALPLSVLWAGEETDEMRRTWPIWLHPVDEGAPGYASAKAMESGRGEG
ncbi:FAD-dependent oxidoreductase [Hypericibacter adhaerens]|nr:FAD-dependent oxidoreductase [Hypericibacter adhaerens]